MKQNKIVLAFGIAVIFMSSIINASINIRLSLDKLVNMSTHIVVGKVTNITSRWNDVHNQIVTDMKFEIKQTVLGKLSSTTITVELPGGTVGEISTIVVDGASFKEGETSLLFLKEIPSENIVQLPHYRLADLVQGKYKILNKNGKTIAVSETIGKVRLLQDESGKSLPPAGEDGIELEILITDIFTHKEP